MPKIKIGTGEISFLDIFSRYFFNLDEELNFIELATALVEDIDLDTVLSNSFGFGGTNASIALSKYTG